MDVLTVLGLAELSEDLSSKLGKTMTRLKDLNTKRNKPVHGVWTLEAIVDVLNQEPRVRCRRYRFYRPADPIKSKQIGDIRNQKLRGQHLFTVTHIENLTKAVDQLRNDLGAFLERAFPRE